LPGQRTARSTARFATARRRRNLRSSQVAVAALAWIAVIGLVSQPSALASPKGAAAGAWTEVGWFWGISRVETVACPTTSMCVAGGQGAVALRSTDGGRSWVGETLPSGVTSLTGIVCPSKSVCEAIGENSATSGATAALLGTTNGGVSWVSQKLPAGMGGTTTGSLTPTVLSAIACPSKSVCEAVGGFANSSGELGVTLRTTDGGRSWVRRTLPGDGEANSVACPSTSTCEVLFKSNGAGGVVVLRTTNGGGSWSHKTVLTGNAELEAIVCPSTSTCMAGGNVYPAAVVLRTTNGGKSWAQETLESQSFEYVDALACRSTSVCEAVTYNDATAVAWRTTDAGTKWADTTIPLTTASIAAITCPSTSVCVAGGYGVGTPGSTASTAVALRTTDNGKRWVLGEALSAGITELTAIACRSTSVCEAAGDSALAVQTTDGGARWVSETLPAGAAGVEAIACPSTRICEAVDGDLAFRTTDGGRTWVSGTLPSGSGQAEAIACPSTSVCEVVGQSSDLAMRTTNGGKSWVSQPATGVEGFNAFSCPSASVCEAIGVSSAGLEESLRTTDGGARWVGQKLPYNLGDIDAIACASASACEAVGATSASVAVTLFACRTPSLCPVLDASSKGPSAVAIHTTDGGRRWLSTKLPSTYGKTLNAVACPTSSVCEAIAGSPTAGVSGPSAGPDVEVFRTTDGGSSWRSQTVPSGISALLSVACPSPSSCEAVGYRQGGAAIIRLH